jgi:ATP-dependent Clp protease ATP-binding subunit ClpC
VFERYTERARRALFFARYESSRLGALTIETEHLLLGLIREPAGALRRVLATLPLETIRSDIEGQTTFREKTPTWVEIPFTSETKRILNFAAEEADRLLHPDIGPEHLLLAILREEESVAAAILAKHGLRLDDVRLQIVQLRGNNASVSASKSVEASNQIEEIRRLVRQLAETPPDTNEARDLVQRISDALDAL